MVPQQVRVWMSDSLRLWSVAARDQRALYMQLGVYYMLGASDSSRPAQRQ